MSQDGIQIWPEAPDPVAVWLVLPTLLTWLLAAVFARRWLEGESKRASFWIFFGLTGAGNLGAVVANDVASFYASYALLTYASYGLVAHARSAAAIRAGRVSFVISLFGEMFILAGLLFTVGGDINLPLSHVPAAVVTGPHRDLVVGMFLVGFGIKLGVVPAHVWLPLAYGAAPLPAAAALAGAASNAGVVGLVRFTPLGLAGFPGWGALLVGLGLTSAFAGAFLGVAQRRPKLVLAYSSASQLGMLAAAIGVGLWVPAAAGAARAAAVLFAVHHGLAKACLFLGAGVIARTAGGWPRILVAAALVWPALEIAGAPLTSGQMAKHELSGVLHQAPPGDALAALLSWSAVGSALLMIRFLLLAAPPRTQAPPGGPPAALWLPWFALLLVDAILAFALAPDRAVRELADPGALWTATWPLAIGIGVALAAHRLARQRAARLPAIPPGDLLVPLAAAAARASHLAAQIGAAVARQSRQLRTAAIARLSATRRAIAALARLESALSRFTGTGAALVALLALLAALLALGV
jgi:formate hydrogenlyase subunit 3/multisubunit Na+/H+ antiporter MnhD subunit